MATVTEADKAILNRVAAGVADITCLTINRLERDTPDTPSMPYRTQWILEETIRILKERV